MSYVALYRKFRPKNFAEVKGQDVIIKTLKNQIKSSKISHAYLFCGTRGTGKTSVAKIMARAVNCENPIDGSPCNECYTCKSIISESSLNIVEMDAASNNGIENIRQIKEQVQYPPSSGKYRVYIIDEVHMLSNQAFNALLKTLEEPPEYVIFILATTELHKIPITVLSRCQRYDFKRINNDTIVENLNNLAKIENIKIEEKALRYIAKLSDGAMRDALSLLDECLAFHMSDELSYENVLEILGTADNDEFENLLLAILNEDISKTFMYIDELVMKGREISQFVSDFLWYLRNLLIIKSSTNPYEIIEASQESIDNMKNISKQISKESLNRYINNLSNLYNRLRNSSQKRVLFELDILRLLNPIMEESKDAILERISKLENNIDKVKFTETRTNTNTEDSLIAKEDIELEKDIIMEKANYEDLLLLKKEWNNIIEGLESSTKVLFKDTKIESFDAKNMTIIFVDKTSHSIVTKQNKIEELNQYINLQYNKEFSFDIKLKKISEVIRHNYINKEEMQQNINMEIEIEN